MGTIRTLQWLKDRLSAGDVADAVFDTLTINTSAEVNGNTVLEEGGEAAATPGFGTARTPDADRPVLLTVEATAETDGTAAGTVELDVDVTGDGATDYTLTVVNVPADNAAGTADSDQAAGVTIPAGGSYTVTNTSDPNAVNAIGPVRETTL